MILIDLLFENLFFMGQKVHPLGFRVGITKKHQSQWFARFNKHKYSQSILEDRMLRQNLMKLQLPSLLQPVLKKIVKREDDTTITPRITQIKIERGLIPYEIGIQIHAENCDLLKSAIDNLKIDRELICKLQKARRYLLNFKLKLKDIASVENQININSPNEKNKATSENQKNSLENQFNTFQKNKSFGSNGGSTKFKKGLRSRSRLTKQEQRLLRKQRFLKKRLRKRQSIKQRYRQLIYKGLLLQKKGNTIFQKLSLKKTAERRKNFSGVSSKTKQGINNNKKSVINKMQPGTEINQQNRNSGQNPFGVRITKKFVQVFINKMNKQFLKHLKENIKYWHNELGSNQGTDRSLAGQKKAQTLGLNKKWSLNRLQNLKTQPLAKYRRLITVLEQKSLLKLESLRKEFIAFGSISKIQSLGYYQIVNFLKHLKDLVNKLKREQKLQYNISKVSNSNTSQLSTGKRIGNAVKNGITKSLNYSKSLNNTLTNKVLLNKLNNIDDECRKMKFIEYFKSLVKKHRTENIYLYLSTIADARKDLKKIQQFTKRHANFLFGIAEPNQMTESTSLENSVSKVLQKSSQKSDFEKTLQDIFLEQLEKQKIMCKQNAQLIPKISIKFYSVKAKSLEAKASIVSESVVDALEKRKAFRKVIKDAKENLMRTSGVKGVKIQVSGRLNGAEIARTEWVRAGRVPLQTLRANLDYSYRTANTIYGIIGVKVWIFKGYTKLLNK